MDFVYWTIIVVLYSLGAYISWHFFSVFRGAMPKTQLRLFTVGWVAIAGMMLGQALIEKFRDTSETVPELVESENSEPALYDDANQ